MVTAFAFGIWFTALSVKYRDVQHLTPFIVQVWLYLTPVAYSVSLVPEKYRLVYALNPMVGVIEGFRWALLGRASPNWAAMGVGLAVTSVVLIGGLFFFRRTERTLADII
jgi:lipopolysaccharide transport system permease protein